MVLKNNGSPDSSLGQDESSNEKSKWGGARPGAGRPTGSMNPVTKQRAAIKQAFQERVAQNADRLFNSQFNLATGEQYLLCKRIVGKGAKQRTVIDTVTDPEIIKQYINDELDGTDDEWYFISTKPANGSAIDSMLDRAFGKADTKFEVEHSGEMGVALNADQAEQLIRARANRSNL